MLMKTCSILLSLFLAASGLGAERADSLPGQPGIDSRRCWHKAPTLSIMTGFIYQPRAVEISLRADDLGGQRQATLVGSDKALVLSESGGRLHFTVEPAPVATVVVQGRSDPQSARRSGPR